MVNCPLKLFFGLVSVIFMVSDDSFVDINILSWFWVSLYTFIL